VAAVGGAALVGTAAWFWRQKKLAGAGSGPKETINFNYVPHLETWPHIDRYPNEHAFGIQLDAWGYDVGPIHTNEQWTVIDALPIQAVSEFQRDFNVVRRIQLPAPVPGPALVEDGLIGNNTANSFWQAEQWTLAMNLTWPQLVELAWAEVEGM
jgi:hypothetical protein